MKSILDKEMPIKKKERRFFWLPILGVAAAALALIYFVSVKLDVTVPSDQLGHEMVSVEENTATNDISKEQSADTKTRINESENLASPPEHSTPIDEKKNSNLLSSANLSTTNSTPDFSNSQITQTPSYSKVDLISNSANREKAPYYEPGGGISNSDEIRSESSMSSALLPNEFSNSSIALDFSVLDKLRIQNLAISYFDQSPQLARHQPIEIKDQKEKPLHWFAGMSGSQLIASNIRFIGLEFRTQQNLTNRVYWRSGIGFNREFGNQNFITVNNLSGAPQEDMNTIDAMVPDNSINLMQPEKLAVSDQLQLQLVDFHAAIGYNLNFKWSGFVGAQLLHQWGNYYIKSADIANRQSDNFVKKELSEFNVGLMTGLEYNVANGLFLGATYYRSTKEMLPSTLTKGTKDRISIGINYRFK
jgi:opacity protein-like surface antigen